MSNIDFCISAFLQLGRGPTQTVTVIPAGGGRKTCAVVENGLGTLYGGGDGQVAGAASAEFWTGQPLIIEERKSASENVWRNAQAELLPPAGVRSEIRCSRRRRGGEEACKAKNPNPTATKKKLPTNREACGDTAKAQILFCVLDPKNCYISNRRRCRTRARGAPGKRSSGVATRRDEENTGLLA